MILRGGISKLLQARIAIGRISTLIQTPLFWILSIFGNGFVLLGTWLINYFESPTNPSATEFIDCLIWAVGLVTTVGASSLHPITLGGKLVMLVMMVGGAVFLWSYMALFIGTFVDPELKVLEDKLTSLQKHSIQDEEILLQLQQIIPNTMAKNEEVDL